MLFLLVYLSKISFLLTSAGTAVLLWLRSSWWSYLITLHTKKASYSLFIPKHSVPFFIALTLLGDGFSPSLVKTCRMTRSAPFWMDTSLSRKWFHHLSLTAVQSSVLLCLISSSHEYVISLVRAVRYNSNTKTNTTTINNNYKINNNNNNFI